MYYPQLNIMFLISLFIFLERRYKFIPQQHHIITTIMSQRGRSRTRSRSISRRKSPGRTKSRSRTRSGSGHAVGLNSPGWHNGLAPKPHRERQELWDKCGQECFLGPPVYGVNGEVINVGYPICPKLMPGVKPCQVNALGLHAAGSRGGRWHNSGVVNAEHQLEAQMGIVPRSRSRSTSGSRRRSRSTSTSRTRRRSRSTSTSRTRSRSRK